MLNQVKVELACGLEKKLLLKKKETKEPGPVSMIHPNHLRAFGHLGSVVASK